MQHKHALNVVALEQGHSDWAALKHGLERDCINSLQATQLGCARLNVMGF
ncbi:MAG: hypothetical protein AAF708_14555 [Deinococcota bacterium]